MTAHPILTSFVALGVLLVAAVAWLAYSIISEWNRSANKEGYFALEPGMKRRPKRICSNCNLPIGRYHRWHFEAKGPIHNRCDQPTGYPKLTTATK